MASGTVSTAIEQQLIAQWTATPLLLENKTATENGIVMPPDTAIYWVEVSFTGRDYSQVAIGASIQADNRWDEEGVLFLTVFAPIGDGSRTARTYAKQLADLFRGLVLLGGNLEFLGASIGEGAKSDKYSGNYFVIPVDIDWRHVEA